MRRSLRNPDEADGFGAAEGPFVSFTDLLAGIVFMLLIMVAMLMLRQQKAVEDLRGKADPAQFENTIAELERKARSLAIENLGLTSQLGAAQETKRKIETDLGTAQQAKKAIEADLGAAQEAKKAMEADFQKYPRLHPAMVYNKYIRNLSEGVQDFSFQATVAIYLTEDRKRYLDVQLKKGAGTLMFPDKPPPASNYVAPLSNIELVDRCHTLDRAQWRRDCGNGSRLKLTRSGDSYVGQQIETHDGQTGIWDVRIDILAVYDDYFR